MVTSGDAMNPSPGTMTTQAPIPPGVSPMTTGMQAPAFSVNSRLSARRMAQPSADQAPIHRERSSCLTWKAHPARSSAHAEVA